MIRLWVVLYLVMGFLISRVATSRMGARISSTDAFALILVWPLFLGYLAIMAIIHGVGTAGGGR